MREPAPDHLSELDLLSVDERKPQRLDDRFGTPARTAGCNYRMALPHDAVEALAARGAAAWHTTADARRERIRALP